MIIGFALMVLGSFIGYRAALVPLGAALIMYGILSRVIVGQRKRRIELDPILA
jgi:ABC-type methionine transport system permease subunit